MAPLTMYNYISVDPPTCGGDLTATTITQFLESPNYSNSYLGDMDCKWVIKANELWKVIQLTVSS